MLINTSFSGDAVDVRAADRDVPVAPGFRRSVAGSAAIVLSTVDHPDGPTVADRFLFGLLGTMLLCLVAGLGLSL